MTSLDSAEQGAVRKQLEKVLADPVFSSARRLSLLLRFIVEETLAGRGDQLKEYTLGVSVLGRGTGFDPRLDSIVRVEASKLRARLGTYYKNAGLIDPILIELPRGSYAPRFAPRHPGAEAPRSNGAIAVLPFVHLGPEPDGEYVSDGLTEEIINRLGTIPGLCVVARTSAFQFKSKGGNIQEIGRTLGARYLIEGSVRTSQNRLRVNARLIDAGTGYQVWSRTYDQTPDDILGIQAAIADAISTALAGGRSLSTEKTSATELSTEAYNLYLRGRFHRNQWTLEGFEKSVEYFQRALALAPGSAQILAALSEAHVLVALGGSSCNAPHFSGARAAAERAIALDDHCAHAHLTLGWIHHIYDWLWDAGLREFDRALELNPTLSEAWHLKGIFLALRRRLTEAEESFQRALKFDPLALVIQTHAAMVPYFAGNLDEAESRAEAAIALEPNFAEAHWTLGWVYERQQRYREALEAFQKSVQVGGENPLSLTDIAFLHARLGEFDRAREIVARLETGFPRPHPSASGLARVHLSLGDRAKSNTWLEEAFEARDIMLPWICADPKYEDLWPFPALSDLRRQILGAAAF